MAAAKKTSQSARLLASRAFEMDPIELLGSKFDKESTEIIYVVLADGWKSGTR